ncbi:YqgE/AlgH family protein [Oceaniglobus ichthyenteri]|uniref:YqgE/AlgH family protein n=1 Tax=Oceaniglobus ichthyenteri TaxID=2136177 RepID=UPI000D39F03A|nr:YqgE/AlgH family protein [Oceaniglobus ichthyenteri]
MEQEHTSEDLAGKLLIAMPGMGDPRFERSVIYICEHDDDNTMGLIINKPLPDLKFISLLEQLEIETGPATRAMPVHFGGPVENGRGFVLHSDDYRAEEGTLDVGDDFAMTATRDVLSDLAAGNGPARAILTLGYSGWGPGQLMSEILENGWLTCHADPDVVFAKSDETKWAAALGLLGIDPLTLSAAAGRA